MKFQIKISECGFVGRGETAGGVSLVREEHDCPPALLLQVSSPGSLLFSSVKWE